MGRLTKLLTVAALSIAIPAAASAHSVQPMIYTLTPTGPKAIARLRVINSRGNPLNVELEAFSVAVSEDGKRTFTPADKDLLIYPAQAAIASDKSQLIQVRYTGDPVLQQGRIYVVRVKQTNPIALTTASTSADGAQGKFGLLINFNTTAVVQPESLKSEVVIDRGLSADAQGRLHARVVNRGAAVADLTRCVWRVERDGKPYTLQEKDIEFGETAMLAPGAARVVTLGADMKGVARLEVAQDRGKAGG